jgi:hypothetical protein
MPISTYTDLQSAVASWLARDDLAANIADFIMLFEAAANRRLRVRAQEASVALSPASGVAALPADYLAWRRVTWPGAGGIAARELEYVHPSYLRARYPTVPAGAPALFTIEGGSLIVRPVDDTPLDFDYFQKIPALAAANPTNWLLAAWPDLYLFGALAEAHGFVKDADSLALWGARRNELFDEIERLDAKTRGPGAIRIIGATP